MLWLYLLQFYEQFASIIDYDNIVFVYILFADRIKQQGLLITKKQTALNAEIYTVCKGIDLL